MTSANAIPDLNFFDTREFSRMDFRFREMVFYGFESIFVFMQIVSTWKKPYKYNLTATKLSH